MQEVKEVKEKGIIVDKLINKSVLLVKGLVIMHALAAILICRA